SITSESADMEQCGSVPVLGDERGSGQRHRKRDVPGNWRMDHRCAVLATGEDRALVESEAIDVHLFDPELQALDDELLYYGVVTVHGIAAAAVVHVILTVPRHQVIEDA